MIPLEHHNFSGNSHRYASPQMYFWRMLVLVLELSGHLLLTEACPSMALQLKGRFICEDDIIKRPLSSSEICTPVQPLLLVGISNCLTVVSILDLYLLVMKSMPFRSHAVNSSSSAMASSIHRAWLSGTFAGGPLFGRSLCWNSRLTMILLALKSLLQFNNTAERTCGTTF